MRRIQKVYFDYAAATPIDKRVLLAIQPFEQDLFYNPSSNYVAARWVKEALESARFETAQSLGAKKSEIIFTSGATESINLALRGIANQYHGSAIITSNIEHEAVLATAKDLSRDHQLTIIDCQDTGIISASQIEAAISDETVLISIMLANNEIGTIQPIAQIASIVAKVRMDRFNRDISLPLYLHTDASAAAGYLDLHVSRLGVDMMTLNAAKIYGPKGSGCLYVRSGLRLMPEQTGGGQEFGLRHGTPNVAAAVGLAKSLTIAQVLRDTEHKRLELLNHYLFEELKKALPEVQLNGATRPRLVNNLNLLVPNLNGEMAVLYLDEAGIMAATGSACSAASTEPSHVLLAIGRSKREASSSLRFTLGRQTKLTDVNKLIKVLPGIVSKLT